MEVTRCRVTESGEMRVFERDQYFYAFYCVEEKDQEDLLGSCDDPKSVYGGHPRANVAIFVRAAGANTVRLVVSELAAAVGGNRPRLPRIVVTPFSAVMELPLVLAATCECNAGSYYRFQPQTRRWRRLDWETWRRQLDTRLPRGLRSVDGFWPDLGNMTAEGALWRGQDAHCCPTGGIVRVRLGIVDNRFVLKSFQVSNDLSQTP